MDSWLELESRFRSIAPEIDGTLVLSETQKGFGHYSPIWAKVEEGPKGESRLFPNEVGLVMQLAAHMLRQQLPPADPLLELSDLNDLWFRFLFTRHHNAFARGEDSDEPFAEWKYRRDGTERKFRVWELNRVVNESANACLVLHLEAKQQADWIAKNAIKERVKSDRRSNIVFWIVFALSAVLTAAVVAAWK